MSDTGREVQVRISVSSGDVIANGQDLPGDGVTVAAGLQALAGHGGMIVGKTLADHANGKTDFCFRPPGFKRLKNTDLQVKVYRAKPETPEPEKRRTALWFAAPAAVLALGAGLFLAIPVLVQPSRPPGDVVLALDGCGAVNFRSKERPNAMKQAPQKSF